MNLFHWSFLPSADSRWAVACYKQKYIHEVLVNRLMQVCLEKSVVSMFGGLTG